MSFTLNVQELRAPHTMHSLKVRWYDSIKNIKDALHNRTGQPPRNIDLFYGTNPSRLTNNLTLHDIGIEKDGYVLRLTINGPTAGNNTWGGENSFVLTPSRDVELSDDCERMLSEVSTGLKRGVVPMKTDVFVCTGGVYFMRNTNGNKIAVFKPHDEEQGMPNNGKGYEGNGDVSLRPNFRPGQGCIREVAAYIMDVDDFTGVPPTTLVHCEHNAFIYPNEIEYGRNGNNIYRTGKTSTRPFPKLGSLQHFVNSDGTFEDVGSSVISDFEIQKIALFDMRLLNCDRNASNILVAKKLRVPKTYYRSATTSRNNSDSLHDEHSDVTGRSAAVPSQPPTTSVRATEEENKDRYLLIPIDHGYSLPTKLDIKEWDWVWFNLPHVRRPVHPAIKEYILSLDFEDLISKLTSQVAIAEDSLFLLRLSHNLLVSGIKAGLTLHQIASLIARLDEQEPSPVERAILVAEENAHRSMEMRAVRANGRNTEKLRAPPSSPMRVNSIRKGGKKKGSHDDGKHGFSTSSSSSESNSTEISPRSEYKSNNITFDDYTIGGNVDFRTMTITGGAIKKAVQGARSGPGSQRDSATQSASASASDHEAAPEPKYEINRAPLGAAHNVSVRAALEKSFGLDAVAAGIGSDDISSCEISPKGFTSNEASPKAPAADIKSALASKDGSLGPAIGPSYGLGVGTNDKIGPGNSSGLALVRLSSTGGQFDEAPSTPVRATSSFLPNSWQSIGLDIPQVPSSLSGGPSTGTSSANTTPGGPLVRQNAVPSSLSNSSTEGIGSLGASGAKVNTGLPPRSPRSPLVTAYATHDVVKDHNTTAGGGENSSTKSTGNALKAHGSDDCLPSKVVRADDLGPTLSGKVSPSANFTTKPLADASGSVTTSESCGSDSSSADTVSIPAVSGSDEAQNIPPVKRSSPKASMRQKSPTNSTRRTHTPSKKGYCHSAEVEGEADIDTGSGTDMEDASPNDDVPDSSELELKATGLQRIASFTAFGSQPLYDLETSERRFGKLVREKRRHQVSTSEFRKLRGLFTQDRIGILIGQLASPTAAQTKKIRTKQKNKKQQKNNHNFRLRSSLADDRK
eukprot:GSChrysophyteH1.ASY1.ANO1.3020.1 assembled CDS